MRREVPAREIACDGDRSKDQGMVNLLVQVFRFGPVRLERSKPSTSVSDLTMAQKTSDLFLQTFGRRCALVVPKDMCFG